MRAIRRGAVALTLLIAACGDPFAADGVMVGPGAEVGGAGDIATLDVPSDWRDGLGDSAPDVADLPDMSSEVADDVAPADVADAVTAAQDSQVDAELDLGSDVEEPQDSVVDIGCVCPPAQVCFDPGANAAPLCLPDPAFACAPCQTDATCLGGHCVTVGDGKYCRIPCAQGVAGSSCPAGFACVADAGGQLGCEPQSGSCSCGPQNLGMVLACGTVGICAGSSTCTGTGWSPCSAGTSGSEACNGLDDDCDGQTDEDLTGKPCGLAADPWCQGQTTCNPAQGLGCTATPSGAEVCNGHDDDCNGATDEGLSEVGAICSLSTPAGTCVGYWQCGGAVGL
ncbi:MAG: hypothetical protein HY902_04070 [Deltaproteobacteria bacterium]|nr:hypothetical protein [Deltaproteobacteria bacterium]